MCPVWSCVSPPGHLEETGAVNGDFVADVIQKLFDRFLKLHHLVGLLLQRSLVVLVRLLQVCATELYYEHCIYGQTDIRSLYLLTHSRCNIASRCISTSLAIVPFRSWSLSLACRRRSLASCCRSSALFLASAMPSPFSEISPSTMVYLSFSSPSRFYIPIHTHRQDFLVVWIVQIIILNTQCAYIDQQLWSQVVVWIQLQPTNLH